MKFIGRNLGTILESRMKFKKPPTEVKTRPRRCQGYRNLLPVLLASAFFHQLIFCGALCMCGLEDGCGTAPN